MEYKILKSGKETYRYLHEGRGKTVLFLHGFGVEPKFNEPIIKQLSKIFEVIAPSIYGMNYLRQRPLNITECAEKTYDFVSELKFDEDNILGISLGGAVGLEYLISERSEKKLLSINPVLPNNNTIASFMKKTISKNIKESLGLLGGTKGFVYGNTLAVSGLFNLLKHPKDTLQLVQSICDYQLPATTVPAHILLAEHDEYFAVNSQQQQLIQEKMPKAKIKIIKGWHHDSPIFEPRIPLYELMLLIRSEV